MSQNQDIQASQYVIRLLEESKHKSDDILDVLPGVFAILNQNFLVTRSNFQLAKLFDSDPELCLLKDFRELVHPEDIQRLTVLIAELSTVAREPQTIELKIRCSDTYREHIFNLHLIQRSAESNEFLVLLMGEDVSQFKRLTSEKARMKSELDMARKIQSALLPEPVAEIGSMGISGSYTPATECGGDWWYYFKHGPNLICCIADVSGHGVPASLLTSGIRSAISILENQPVLDLQAATKLLNQVVIDCAKGNQFTTFSIMSVDLSTGACKFIRAGHEPFFHVKRKDTGPADLNGQIVSILGEQNTLLGNEASADFYESDFELQPGERVFFYTDGLIDLLNDRKHVGGLRRLSKFLFEANQHAAGAHEFNEAVLTLLRPRMEAAELNDDVTFFTIQRK